ncbi:MAG: hypothetical protein J5986_08485, partial [Roseburia sp.]|nr:hypothetical protein [Roseburia sp.]
MAEKDKRGFRMVGQTDMEEYERKLKAHRRKVAKRTISIILVIIAVTAAVALFMALRHYENFDILESVERADTEATHFAEFR